MANKKSFKEIRKKMNEITKRPPSDVQLEDLKNTLIKIEQTEKVAPQGEIDEIESQRKIARDLEVGI